MFSLFLSLVAVASPPLRVCADPANAPFSGKEHAGFDNRIAMDLSAELHRTARFVWVPESAHYVRKTLDAGQCDVLLGVPASLPGVLTTRAYYESSYVFVTRGERLKGFADPALQRMRIGVQIAGNEYTPPAMTMARYGLAARFQAFPVAGDAILRALQARRIDVAVMWGPSAGYFVKNMGKELALSPVPSSGLVPMRFAISAAVKKDNRRLQGELDGAIARIAPRIQHTLLEYGVPVL